MSKHNIEVSNATWLRLKNVADGFETPEQLLNRMVDVISGVKDSKPTLSFSPSDEDVFKNELIKTKMANVVLFKVDGSVETVYWDAQRFTDTSSLRGNIWSSWLRDWKTKQIVSASFEIVKKVDEVDYGVKL